MMKEDFISISLWIIFPLFIILGSMLSACSPFQIKEAEKVSEEIVEDISQEALKH